MAKTGLLLLLLVCFSVPGRAQIRAPQPAVVLYAQFLESTPVMLDDGSKWAMDKGDCFPVDMFKEQQTKIVLKLGSSNFTADAARMRLMKEHETEVALRSYRVTLETYLKTRADSWKKEAAAKAKTPR